VLTQPAGSALIERERDMTKRSEGQRREREGKRRPRPSIGRRRRGRFLLLDAARAGQAMEKD
jgi:hypothetical protein